MLLSIKGLFERNVLFILPLHTISMMMMMTISNMIKKIRINHWEDDFKSAVPFFINIGNRLKKIR